MTSYLSTLNTLLSTTTSRYNSIRRNVLSSSSEDDTKVDSPDQTHISKVLRAYYTEKNLPLPAWLPPDPREAARAAQRSDGSGGQPYVATRPLGSLRSRGSDGSGGGAGGVQGGGGGARGGGLGDIWGDSNNNTSGAGAGREEGSLRRAAVTGRWAGSQAPPPGQEQRLDVRPLPSQRVGSYQTRYGNAGGAGAEDERPGSSQSFGSQGAASGRDRLKARLGSQRGAGGSYAMEGLSGWQGQGGRR